MRILLRLLGYLRHHLGAVALAYLSLAGALAFTALTPWMLKRAIDLGIQRRSEGALVAAGLTSILNFAPQSRQVTASGLTDARTETAGMRTCSVGSGT